MDRPDMFVCRSGLFNP